MSLPGMSKPDVQALLSLQCLPACPAKRSLELMVEYILDRLS